MSIEDLFNAVFTIKVFQGTERDGSNKPTIEGDSGSCRLEPSDGKRTVNRDGEDILVDAVIWVSPDVAVTSEDDIDVEGILYRILDKIVVPDSDSDHHIEISVRKR